MRGGGRKGGRKGGMEGGKGIVGEGLNREGG